MLMDEQKALESVLKKVEAQQENLGGFMERFDIPEHWAVRKALERQIEINNMALIQSHRKCVLGRDEMYSDSTLQSMSKAQLINLLHVAQNNYSVLLEAYDRRMKAYEKELAAMSDEVKWED